MSVAYAALFLLQVAAVGLSSWMVAGRIDRRGDPLGRCLIATTIALAQVCLVLQGLGALGLLSRGPVLAAQLAVLVAATWRLGWPASRARTAVPDDPSRAVTVIAVAGVVAFALVNSVRGRSDEYDTLHYHAPNAGFFLRVHEIWQLPPVNPGYFYNSYPSNAELLAGWLMLPSGSDEIVYGVNVLWGLLAVLGVAVAARQLGGSPWLGGFLGAVAVATPLVLFTQMHSLVNDLAAASGVVAALAFVLLWREQPGRRAWPLLAGLALGLAVGSKYTALLPGVGVAVFAAVVAPAKARRRNLALFVSGVCALAALWFVRAGLQTGNPLYPLDVDAGGRHLLTGADSPLIVLDTSLAEHVAAGRWEPLRTWADLALWNFGPLVVVIGAGVVGGLRRPRHRERFLVGGLAAACGVAYLFTPFTGGGDEGLRFLIASQLRYAMPMVLLATVVAATMSRRVMVPLGLAGLAFSAFEIVDGPGYRHDIDLTRRVVLAWVLVTAIVLAAVALRRQPRWRTTSPAVRVLACALVALGVVSAVYAAQREDRPSPAEVVLAGLGRPHGPIVFVAVDDVRSLMGRRFQVTIIGGGDGGVAGERPILEPDALDRHLEELAPAVVAVGRSPSATKPAGWNGPSGWRLVASAGSIDYFVPPPVETAG